MSNKLSREEKRTRKAARRAAFLTRDARREQERQEFEAARERTEREQLESLGLWEDVTREQETSNVQKGLDELTYLIDRMMGSGRDTLTARELQRTAQLAEVESHRYTLLGDGNMAEYLESVRQIAAPTGARMSCVSSW